MHGCLKVVALVPAESTAWLGVLRGSDFPPASNSHDPGQGACSKACDEAERLGTQASELIKNGFRRPALSRNIYELIEFLSV
jgi:hypothetical protein